MSKVADTFRRLSVLYIERGVLFLILLSSKLWGVFLILLNPANCLFVHIKFQQINSKIIISWKYR